MLGQCAPTATGAGPHFRSGVGGLGFNKTARGNVSKCTPYIIRQGGSMANRFRIALNFILIGLTCVRMIKLAVDRRVK